MQRVVVLLLLGVLLTACVEAPALPGQLFFRDGDRLLIWERGRTREVSLPERLTAPALSPDGLSLAGVVGEWVLLWADLAGEPEPVGPAPAGRAAITWSPTGDWLAVHGGSELQVVNRHSGDRRAHLLPEPVVAVLWSPDGSKLLVEVGSGSADQHRVYQVQTGAPELAKVADRASGAAWAPDSNRFAYSRWSAPTQSAVYLWPSGELLLDEPTLLAAFPDQAVHFESNHLAGYSLSWAPDGERLVLVAKAAGPHSPRFLLAAVTPGESDLGLWVLPVHSDKQRTDVVIYPPRPCHPRSVAWAEGGLALASLLDGPGCQGQLVLLDPVGMEVLQTVDGLDGFQQLFPAPAGEWIALTGPGNHLFLRSGSPDERMELKVEGELIHWVAPPQRKRSNRSRNSIWSRREGG